MRTPDYELQLPRRRSGVYHLVRDGRVIYVGQSLNLSGRVVGHPFNDYDSARFFYCDPDDLNDLERAHIEALRPLLNIRGVTLPYTKGTPQKGVYAVERARLAAWLDEKRQADTPPINPDQLDLFETADIDRHKTTDLTQPDTA